MANYFDRNGLIFDHPHSVQLSSTTIGEDGGSIILKMVQSKDVKKIPEEELYQIDLLEKDLQKEVFFGANFQLVICNENFEEIAL